MNDQELIKKGECIFCLEYGHTDATEYGMCECKKKKVLNINHAMELVDEKIRIQKSKDRD